MMQDSEFVSLTSVLEPWFEKDRSELPGDLDEAWRGSRQAAGVKFLLSLWDGLSTTQRRTMAAQFDFSHDPANKVAAKAAFEVEEKALKIARRIKKWEAVATPTACDLEKQERTLEELEREASANDARACELATDARAAAGGPGGSPVKPTPTVGCAPDSAEVASSEPVIAPAPAANPASAALRPIPHKRGPDGIKRTAAVSAMVEAVKCGAWTAAQLERLKEKELGRFYTDAKRTTLVAARKDALCQLAVMGDVGAPANSDKTAAKDK
jgi:hypothetical protein